MPYLTNFRRLLLSVATGRRYTAATILFALIGVIAVWAAVELPVGRIKPEAEFALHLGQIERVVEEASAHNLDRMAVSDIWRGGSRRLQRACIGLWSIWVNCRPPVVSSLLLKRFAARNAGRITNKAPLSGGLGENIFNLIKGKAFFFVVLERSFERRGMSGVLIRKNIGNDLIRPNHLVFDQFDRQRRYPSAIRSNFGVPTDLHLVGAITPQQDSDSCINTEDNQRSERNTIFWLAEVFFLGIIGLAAARFGLPASMASALRWPSAVISLSLSVLSSSWVIGLLP